VANLLSAREAGEALDLTHLEVIRRIRRGQIRAKKVGWFWLVNTEEVNRVRKKRWYLGLMEKRRRRGTAEE